MTHHQLKAPGKAQFTIDERTEVHINNWEPDGDRQIHLWMNRSGVRLAARLSPEETKNLAQQLIQLAETAREPEEGANDDRE